MIAFISGRTCTLMLSHGAGSNNGALGPDVVVTAWPSPHGVTGSNWEREQLGLARITPPGRRPTVYQRPEAGGSPSGPRSFAKKSLASKKPTKAAGQYLWGRSL